MLRVPVCIEKHFIELISASQTILEELMESISMPHNYISHQYVIWFVTSQIVIMMLNPVISI